MKVYLIDIETNKLKQTYKNVIEWDKTFVEYNNRGKCKIYCNIMTEYFTDILLEENLDE